MATWATTCKNSTSFTWSTSVLWPSCDGSRAGQNTSRHIKAIQSVLSMYLRVCVVMFVCVWECVLTLMNVAYIRAICYHGSIKQPQITSGNMFLKRAPNVRCCLVWAHLCINLWRWACVCVFVCTTCKKMCVCMYRCLVSSAPILRRWVQCMWKKWRISLSAPTIPSIPLG